MSGSYAGESSSSFDSSGTVYNATGTYAGHVDGERGRVR
jgi:hypothetical protein